MEHLHGLSFDRIKKHNWDDVSIAEFFLIKEIGDNTSLDVTAKLIKKLSIVTAIPETDLKSFKINDIKDFYDQYCKWVDTQKIKGELKDYYHINGKKYFLVKQFGDIEFNQLVDLQTKSGVNPGVENLHNLLAIFLIPVKPLKLKDRLKNRLYNLLAKSEAGQRMAVKIDLNYHEGETEKYCETPPDITADEIYYHLPITDAIAINVFFCQVEKSFSKVLVLYLDLKAGQEMILALTTLEKMERTPEVQDLINKINFQLDGPGLFALTN